MSEQLELTYGPEGLEAPQAISDQAMALLYRNHPMAYRLAKSLSMQSGLDGAEHDWIFLLVNALGAAIRQGHVCLDLKAIENTAVLRDFAIEQKFPSQAVLVDAIKAWDFVVSSGNEEDSEDLPLTLDQHRLYLSKYYDWECRLARQLAKRAEATLQTNQLNSQQRDDIDWQKVAVENTWISKLSIVVGGPGTGKTTTVAEILKRILEAENNPEYRIGLAAPTGKAAARMAGSLAQKMTGFDLDEKLVRRVPQTAQTLHRLLGWMPAQRRFRYNKSNPLILDCLVVDEVSMIDMSLFLALLEALPEDARLILLGDPFQLASVQAGNVLAELCEEKVLDGFSDERASLLGLANSKAKSLPPLADNVVFLRKSYRFKDDRGIGPLAKACLAGDWTGFNNALKDDVVDYWPKDDAQAEQQLIERLGKHHDYVAGASSIEEAFKRLAEFQLLCANRQNEWSTEYFNSRMAQLVSNAESSGDQIIYHGMPIMMQTNVQSMGLYNGDIGLVFRDGERLFLYFDTAEKGIVRFVPSQVRGWSPAHAITVHKSQGSEYTQVAIVLPQADSPLQNRQMLYTAITRAKESVVLLATDTELQRAVSVPTQRFSGLRDRLPTN